MTACEFWLSTLSGVVGNAIFTIVLIFVIQQLRYFFTLRNKFHNTTFKSYWKRFPEEEVHVLNIKVKRNIIYLTGNRIGSNDTFKGEIIISPINLRLGKGFHIHSKSDGFAFLKVIIEDSETLLVESSYIGAKKHETNHKTVGFDVAQAFIWKKQK